MNAAGYETGSVGRGYLAGMEQGNRNREAKQMERGREYRLNQMGRVDQNAQMNQQQGDAIYSPFLTNTPQGDAVYKPADPFMTKMKDFFGMGQRAEAEAPPQQAVPTQTGAPPLTAPKPAAPPLRQVSPPMQQAGSNIGAEGGGYDPGASPGAMSYDDEGGAGYEAPEQMRAVESPQAVPIGQVNAPTQEIDPEEMGMGYANGGDVVGKAGMIASLISMFAEGGEVVSEAEAARRWQAGLDRTRAQQAAAPPVEKTPAIKLSSADRERLNRADQDRRGVTDASKASQEKMVADAAARRGRETAGVERSTTDAKKTLGSRVKAGVTRATTSPGVRKAISGGKGLAVGALAGNVMNSMNPWDEDSAYSAGTDDYARELGIPDTQVGQEGLPGMAKDTAIRTIGVVNRLGRGLLPESLTPESGGRVPKPEPKAAPQVAGKGPSTRPSGGAARGSAAPTPTPRGAPRRAVPAEPQGPPQEEEFDMSQFHPQDVPNMSTTDWEGYRAAAMREQRRLGTSGLQALKMVDETITAMQQNGFKKYAQQGMAQERAGNLQGAMSAYRAAYQYFPTGFDVKLGLYKNKIVGLGTDEKTGKPAGEPQLINVESMAAMVNNLSDPAAWNQWAKDRREFERNLKNDVVDNAYRQNTGRYQTSMAETAARNADTAAQNADTMETYRGPGGSGAGGLSSAALATDLRATQGAARKELEMLATQNPELARFLTSEIALAQKAMPQVPAATIIEMVLNKYKERMAGAPGQP